MGFPRRHSLQRMTGVPGWVHPGWNTPEHSNGDLFGCGLDSAGGSPTGAAAPDSGQLTFRTPSPTGTPRLTGGPSGTLGSAPLVLPLSPTLSDIVRDFGDGVHGAGAAQVAPANPAGADQQLATQEQGYVAPAPAQVPGQVDHPETGHPSGNSEVPGQDLLPGMSLGCVGEVVKCAEQEPALDRGLGTPDRRFQRYLRSQMSARVMYPDLSPVRGCFHRPPLRKTGEGAHPGFPAVPPRVLMTPVTRGMPAETTLCVDDRGFALWVPPHLENPRAVWPASMSCVLFDLRHAGVLGVNPTPAVWHGGTWQARM